MSGRIDIEAAVCRSFGAPLTIETLRLNAPGPDEVRVRLSACAICHSDIHYADGAWGGDLPAVYGHEASGVVESTGGEVDGLNAGERVIVTLVRSCGSCACCRKNYPGSCTGTFDIAANSPLSLKDGTSVIHGMGTAAFADTCLVHRSQIVKMPESLPFNQASLLACGVLTGFGAATNSAQLQPGETAVVIGTGGVGLNAVQGAAHSGAGMIIALDISDEKRRTAEAFGATHSLDPSACDTTAEVMRLTGGAGADHVFITVGAPAAFENALSMLANGGKLVVVGMPASGVTVPFDPGTLATCSQTIVGSKMGAAHIHTDIPALAGLYLDGHLKLDELITQTYPLSAINEAIADTKAGKALRNVITFES